MNAEAAMQRRFFQGPVRWAVVVGFGLLMPSGGLVACTTAVVSGRATADGRPLLWKNRDTRTTQHNEVVIFEEGRYRAVAVVNAGDRGSIWMGTNAAGFCIENSVSRDLAVKEKTKGPGNGRLMKQALQSCATVEDFRQLLEKTNSGRSTIANFGVIDASGGAAIFETGPHSYTIFDANDPVVAPHGYIVRSNFSTTGSDLPALPSPEQLTSIYSGDRYNRACQLLEQAHGEECISLEYMLRNMTRDLCAPDGCAIAGTVNGGPGELPAEIATDCTISRTTTVSAAVFHGVRPGEPAERTTMWTLLGDPKFSIAVPCWAASTHVADALTDDLGGELGEIAIKLREWSLNSDRSGVQTAWLPGIWEDLWPVEDRILSLTREFCSRTEDGVSDREQIAQFHAKVTRLAMDAMEQELEEMKQAAPLRPAPPAPTVVDELETVAAP